MQKAVRKGDRYREQIQIATERLKRGEITQEEFDRIIESEYDEYLEREHTREGDTKIFIKLVLQTKNRCAGWKDDYYCGQITRGEYLRGMSGDQGARFYDKRLFELGLATDRWPDQMFDNFLWKAYKIERSIIDERLIDPSNKDCPPGMAEAAKQTLNVMFEAMDDFHQRFVPSQRVGVRSREWIQIPEEAEAYDLPPSTVTVTDRERQQFEAFRNEQSDPRQRRLP